MKTPAILGWRDRLVEIVEDVAIHPSMGLVVLVSDIDTSEEFIVPIIELERIEVKKSG